MAVIETWLKQDLKKPVQVKELGGHLFSADNMANLIGVGVFSDGSPVSLVDGATAYVIRDDGYTVAVTGTVSGNRVSVVLPESCYAVVGPISIVIKNGRTTVGACRGYVYRSSTDAVVDPGHVVPSLDELLAQISTMQTATAQAQTATSDANAAAAAANSAASAASAAIEVADDAADEARTAREMATNAQQAATQARNTADQAQQDAATAISGIRAAAAGATEAAESAGNSKNEATRKADEAAEQAKTAEAWAVGQRGGVNVPATNPAYHNNAKYYAGKTAEDRAATSQAEQAVAAGVSAAQEAVGQAQGYTQAAETAADEAREAAQEAAETVVAAQGPGILYVDTEGIPYVLE